MAPAGRPPSPGQRTTAAAGALAGRLRNGSVRAASYARARLNGRAPGPSLIARQQRDFLPQTQASPIELRLRPVAARLRRRRLLEELPLALTIRPRSSPP